VVIGVKLTAALKANLVLQSTVERVFAPPESVSGKDPEVTTSGRALYADIPRGIFLVRGENVLLLGEIDLDKDDDPPPGYEKADVELVQSLAKARKSAEMTKEKDRFRKLAALGFEGENMGEVLL
jgi:U6 snRNA-associated Sm-like protein LSm1